MATPTQTSTQLSDQAWQAIQGGYDVQVHVAPDVIPRRIDDLDLAREFLSAGLKGFVLKSHYFPRWSPKRSPEFRRTAPLRSITVSEA
jgi:hypothetical protein